MVGLKLRLRTTHPPIFLYGKRCWKYLLLYQKSSAWVVCRRRYGHFTIHRTKMTKKRAETQKRQEIHFQFLNLCKKSKMEKRKQIYLDFFRFYIPCAFFCILNLKIHTKKDKNAKKKLICFFNFAKSICKKKSRNAKKMQKSKGPPGGAWLIFLGISRVSLNLQNISRI